MTLLMFVAINIHFGNFLKCMFIVLLNLQFVYWQCVLQIPPFKKNPKMQERGHFSVAKEVRDRTTLSDDLASFCAKYPIIRLHENPEATAGNTATFAR